MRKNFFASGKIFYVRKFTILNHSVLIFLAEIQSLPFLISIKYIFTAKTTGRQNRTSYNTISLMVTVFSSSIGKLITNLL